MRTIYLSEQANPILINHITEKGYQIVLVEKTSLVYPQIAAHPDIYMCKMGVMSDSPLFFGAIEELGNTYPLNVKFNGICTGKFFIHNLMHTSPALLSRAKQMGMTLISVKQGYTKCSCVLVDENSLITPDAGIARTLAPYPIDVLLIEKGHVKLEGFQYGFIGGASGRIRNDIIFHGNLEMHPDFLRMKDFVESKGLCLKYFQEFELSDIGSIFEIEI